MTEEKKIEAKDRLKLIKPQLEALDRAIDMGSKDNIYLITLTVTASLAEVIEVVSDTKIDLFEKVKF